MKDSDAVCESIIIVRLGQKAFTSTGSESKLPDTVPYNTQRNQDENSRQGMVLVSLLPSPSFRLPPPFHYEYPHP